MFIQLTEEPWCYQSIIKFLLTSYFVQVTSIKISGNHTNDASEKSENINTKCLLVELPHIWLFLVCRSFKLKSSKLLSVKYDFLPSSRLLSVTNCVLFIFPNISNWWEGNGLALKSPRKAALTRFAVLLCRSMYLPLPWVYKPPTSWNL